MAITDSQKIDLLWKKIGFGKAKTDTNSNKKAPNEPNASSLIIKDSDIWNQSASITGTIPSANSSVTNVYIDSVSGALETTEDGASSDNRTWKRIRLRCVLSSESPALRGSNKHCTAFLVHGRDGLQT